MRNIYWGLFFVMLSMIWFLRSLVQMYMDRMSLLAHILFKQTCSWKGWVKILKAVLPQPSAEIKYYMTPKKYLCLPNKSWKSIFNTIKDTHQGLLCFILQSILNLQQYLMMIPIPFGVPLCKCISPINWQDGFILQSCWAEHSVWTRIKTLKNTSKILWIKCKK